MSQFPASLHNHYVSLVSDKPGHNHRSIEYNLNSNNYILNIVLPKKLNSKRISMRLLT